MPKIKHLTPQQIAAIMAVIIAFPLSVIYGLVFKNAWYALAFFLIMFLGIYWVSKYFINTYVYSKLKIIYKLIHQTKASKREETYYKYILPKKTINDVNIEVENWAKNFEEEQEVRKKNEQYRKEFLQNISHELKTPIFAIQGYVEALLDSDIEDKFIEKFLKNTERNVQRMVVLMQDLDEITKLETGEQPLYKEKFVIQDLVREVIEALSIKINNKGINAFIKKDCETPNKTVFADREKTRQVLTNFIENATKYGKDHGNIMIGIYKTEDGNILTEVTDDGIGIADEHVNRVFERFFRTDTARSRDAGGSGLGLAICKHIIEAHGQHIHVRSKLNVGSTFGFSLPEKA